MELTGKIALVTGGASGIGRAASQQIGREGGTVVIADVNEKLGDQAADELRREGQAAEFVKLDVARVPEIRRILSRVVSRHGRIDILVNAAGIGRLTRIPDITPEEWDLVMTVNLRSAFFCSQEALKTMCPRGYGKIVNIASAAGKIGGVAVGAHYAASKAAVICLTKSLALHAAAFHVNVNSVCPGPIATPLTDSWGEEVNEAFAAKIPFGHYGSPEDVAEAIVFLVSDRSRYITGETLDVNGGLVMD